jgi:hypothetical protein
MVGDEKREKIESYGGTSTEVYVDVCCWRKLRKWLNFENFSWYWNLQRYPTMSGDVYDEKVAIYTT